MDPVGASMAGLFLGLAAVGNIAVDMLHKKAMEKANREALVARNMDRIKDAKVRRSKSEEYSKQEFAKYSRERRLSEDSERLKEDSKKLKEKNDNLQKSNEYLVERIKELEKQNQEIIFTSTSPSLDHDDTKPLMSPKVKATKNKTMFKSSPTSPKNSENSEDIIKSPELPKSASPIIKRVKDMFSPKMLRKSAKSENKQDMHDNKAYSKAHSFANKNESQSKELLNKLEFDDFDNNESNKLLQKSQINKVSQSQKEEKYAKQAANKTKSKTSKSVDKLMHIATISAGKNDQDSTNIKKNNLNIEDQFNIDRDLNKLLHELKPINPKSEIQQNQIDSNEGVEQLITGDTEPVLQL